MKRIIFLAPSSNYHTKKWCSYFYSQGYEVHVISLTPEKIPNIQVHYLLQSNNSNDNEFRKLKYLTTLTKLNGLIRKIKPDIVSVHYATSYGLLAALSNIKKYSLSVWGTDVYAFPRKSVIHKQIIKFCLKKASVLLSTSHAMAKECKHYTNRSFYITPFGVDIDVFHPGKKEKESSEKFIISTLKSLSPEYGIDVLLKAVKDIRDFHPYIPIQVNVAGKGPSEDILKRMSKDLELEGCINWLGFISQDEIAETLRNSDIAVIPSYRESFGVSAVEAQACGIPVVITDVEGLKEATSPGETSIVVNTGDYKGLSKAIVQLYENESIRKKMGESARKIVCEKFEYQKCFRNIEEILNKF